MAAASAFRVFESSSLKMMERSASRAESHALSSLSTTTSSIGQALHQKIEVVEHSFGEGLREDPIKTFMDVTDFLDKVSIVKPIETAAPIIASHLSDSILHPNKDTEIESLGQIGGKVGSIEKMLGEELDPIPAPSFETLSILAEVTLPAVSETTTSEVQQMMEQVIQNAKTPESLEEALNISANTSSASIEELLKTSEESTTIPESVKLEEIEIPEEIEKLLVVPKIPSEVEDILTNEGESSALSLNQLLDNIAEQVETSN